MCFEMVGKVPFHAHVIASVENIKIKMRRHKWRKSKIDVLCVSQGHVTWGSLGVKT